MVDGDLPGACRTRTLRECAVQDVSGHAQSHVWRSQNSKQKPYEPRVRSVALSRDFNGSRSLEAS